MKRRLVFAFVMILTATSLAHAAQPVHKYDIQSGKISLDISMKMEASEIKTQAIVYFDDFGVKECKETYVDGELKDIVLCDGNASYALKPNKKSAVKIGDAFHGTDMRMDINEMGTKEDRASGRVQQIALMQIADKTCELIEVVDDKGGKSRYAGYKKIMMYMQTGSNTMTTTIKAISIEEDVAVPAAKFQIPAGYTLK
jgi:hypothetical protein